MSETTPGGSPVYRHQQPVPQQAPAAYDEALRDAIEKHLAQSDLREPRILHEIVSEGVHLDVYVYAPTPDHRLWTLVTVGMSERPMNVPEGAEGLRRCELVLTLPETWPMPEDPAEFQRVMSDERNYWPIRMLKQTGHLPHEYDTWVGFGHTLTADEDGSPYDGSDFTGVVLGLPMTLVEQCGRLDRDGQDPIWFWGVYPLYADEMDFKLQAGAEALFGRLMDAEVPEGVWNGRASVAPQQPAKRRWFGRR